LKMTLAEADRQNKMIDRETALTTLAATSQVNMDKINKDFALGKYKSDWDIKAFYEELELKKQESLTANYGLSADGGKG